MCDGVAEVCYPSLLSLVAVPVAAADLLLLGLLSAFLPSYLLIKFAFELVLLPGWSLYMSLLNLRRLANLA